jgi:tetratricopeptide (TPR) repeat protein
VNFNRISSVLLAVGQPREALDASRKDLAITQKLADADPKNPLLIHDLWASHYTVANVLVDLKEADEARAAYRDSLAMLQKAAALDPSVVRWQLDLVVNHHKLRELGDEPLVHLTAALGILRRLDSEGRLPADRKAWIPIFEQWFKDLQN